MGGPGEEAITAGADFARMFGSLRNDRDILLVDQRGTGRSATLACILYSDEDAATSLRDLFPVAAVERCRQQLSARADLTQYSFARVANDLEHIRRTLGYGRLNLSAGSYGTRAAQVYVRAYPQNVRTVLLHSIVPIDIPMPLPMARTAEAAMESTLKACAVESACNAAFPNIRDELHQIIARLDSGTVRVAVPGGSDTAQLHRGRVAEWFRSQLYRPATAATLPWLIHQAYMGNWSPIVEGILTNARGLDTALSIGVFFSITCSEDIAFVREEDVSRQTQGTFLGDYRVRQQQAACKQWLKGSIPASYRSLVRSSVPALFVSGDRDGGTPLSMTDHAAKGFLNRAEVVMRNQGHTEWNDCVAKLYEQFAQRHGSWYRYRVLSSTPTAAFQDAMMICRTP
jgi:pimeloyl-ACP methyl ester carboxylesterase